MSPDKIDSKSITLYEFREALALSNSDKAIMLSIFNEKSNSDGVFSVNDYKNLEEELSKEKQTNKKNNNQYKTSLVNFFNLIQNILKKAGGKLSDKIAENIEKENIGKDIENIDVDKQSNTTKVQCKTKDGGQKIIEYSNETHTKVKEVEHDKSGKLTKSTEFVDGKPLKSVELNNDKTIIISYSEGKQVAKRQFDNSKREQIDTFYNRDGSRTEKKYKKGVLLSSSEIRGKNYKKTFYKTNGSIDYVEDKKGDKITTTKYYDNKSLEQISSGLEALKKQLTGANSIFKNDDTALLAVAFTNNYTISQLQAYFGEEVFFALIDSNKELGRLYSQAVLKDNRKALAEKTEQSYYSEPTIDINKYDIKLNPKKVSSDTTYVEYAQENNFRAKVNPWDEAYFDTRWVQEDKSHSTTIFEFMENIKKDYKVEYDKKLGKDLVAGIRNTNYTNGYCYAHVFDSFVNTGRRIKNSALIKLGGKTHNSAFQSAEELANSDIFIEVPRNIVASMDLNDLPDGAVPVFDANYRTDRFGNHVRGHIAICYKNPSDGKVYTIGATGPLAIDDLINGNASRETHLRIFIPVAKVL